MGSIRVKFGNKNDGIGESNTPAGQPESYHLYQNHPNPFNPLTIISYSLPESGDVELVVFDVRGQKVVTLFHGLQQGGDHSIIWNGDNESGVLAPSGIYFYSLRAGHVILIRKCLLLK
jgi:hypothetical protein